MYFRAKSGSSADKVRYIKLSVPEELREVKLEYYWICISHRKSNPYLPPYIHSLTIFTSENEVGLQAVLGWLWGTTWHTAAPREPNRHMTLHLMATWHTTGLLQHIVLNCWEQCAPHRPDFWHQEVVASAQKPWLNANEKSIKKIYIFMTFS